MAEIATAYERHAPELRRWVAAQGATWEEAEDVVQEVFLRFLCYQAAYREQGALRGYLFMIARHRLVEVARTYQRRQRLEAAWPKVPGTMDAPAPPPDWFARLPQSWRRVLVLAAEGHDCYSGAEALGTTPGAYKSLLHRARQAAKGLCNDKTW